MTLFKNIASSILVIGIFALHPSLNKGKTPITFFQHLVYGNTLDIATNSSIDQNQLEIRWICETENIACKDLVIFKNGKQISEIPSAKGNQKLVVFYKKNKIGEINQNKSSKYQAHEYNIELLSKNNSLYFNGKIIGPSPYIGKPTTIASI